MFAEKSSTQKDQVKWRFYLKKWVNFHHIYRKPAFFSPTYATNCKGRAFTFSATFGRVQFLLPMIRASLVRYFRDEFFDVRIQWTIWGGSWNLQKIYTYFLLICQNDIHEANKNSIKTRLTSHQIDANFDIQNLDFPRRRKVALRKSRNQNIVH